MNNTVLIDAALPLLQEYLDALWRAVEQPRALYARGSAILSEDLPWDMDFVLFVGSNKSMATSLAAEIMTQIRLSLPDLPPPDISIVLDNQTSPDSLFALLLVTESGKLLFGEDNRPSLIFFPNHCHVIWQYALKTTISRLIAFEICTNPAEQIKRAPHLAKSVLRLGGLLEIQNGHFTRQPKKCADWLCTLFPESEKDITLLLRSLETNVEPNSLSKACQRIIAVITRMFQHDQ